MYLETDRERVEKMGWRPRNCVWELTLACNLRCGHCGSRAGKVRPQEMSVDECLGVVDQLANMGCELITLSGGEPTLKKGWDRIARAIADRGIYVNMVTNGAYGTPERAREVAARAKASGMCNVGVSIDGNQLIHDHVRGPGTFADSIAAIGHFTAAGLRTAVMTTISRLNLAHLREIRQIAMDAGATMWRLQLAKPMGTMDEHRDLVIDPKDLLTLMPLLASLKKEGGIHLAVGDSIGYYGPYDKVLRGRGWRGRKECWKGCQAGMQAIGIEADGGVKGCLSLQAKWGDSDPFVEGNLREHTLEEIWHRRGIFAFNREFHTDQLTGGCRACRFGSLCRGGARCVASATLQKLTEDPYCWYRVASDERAKQRRPVTQWAAAAGTALVLSLGGCSDPDPDSATGAGDVADVVSPTDSGDAADPTDATDSTDSTDSDTAEPDVSIEYGMPADATDDDAAITPDYGVFPQDVTEATDATDATDADAHEPDVSIEYGMPVDVTEDDAAITPDYGVFPDDITQPDVGPPDVTTADVADAIDCEAVCCECEYGVIPDEVWKKCCAPDPCADACCECDYGDPPPPECCEDP